MNKRELEIAIKMLRRARASIRKREHHFICFALTDVAGRMEGKPGTKSVCLNEVLYVLKNGIYNRLMGNGTVEGWMSDKGLDEKQSAYMTRLHWIDKSIESAQKKLAKLSS